MHIAFFQLYLLYICIISNPFRLLLNLLVKTIEIPSRGILGPELVCAERRQGMQFMIKIIKKRNISTSIRSFKAGFLKRTKILARVSIKFKAYHHNKTYKKKQKAWLALPKQYIHCIFFSLFLPIYKIII